MTCLILVSINIKASAAALPLVVHSGHRHNSHLNKMLGFVLMRVTSAYFDHNIKQHKQDAWVRPDAYFDYNGRRDHGNHDDRDKEDGDNHEEEKDILSAGVG